MKKWIKDFIEMGFLAILLAILIHYAYNLLFIFLKGEVVIYETSKTILIIEFFLDILAMAYITYKIIKMW
jgi:hypothetical protein